MHKYRKAIYYFRKSHPLRKKLFWLKVQICWHLYTFLGRATLRFQFPPMATAMANKVQIDIVSDIFWPWCYVAKGSLDEALASEQVRAKCDVEVRWHPFLIRPDGKTSSDKNGVAPGTGGAPNGPYWHWAIEREQGSTVLTWVAASLDIRT